MGWITFTAFLTCASLFTATYAANAQAPTVTSVLPNSGPSVGGTKVTITGSNFIGATAIKFGNTTAAVSSVNSATSITVLNAPAGTGAMDVTVTTPSGTSATSAADQFMYVAMTPTVTGISPSSGPTAGGVSVTITGTNFTGTTLGDVVSVTFGHTRAPSIILNSATSITAISPAGTGTVDVVVFRAMRDFG